MIRRCGDSECGHYDSCQMMCNLDFGDSFEGEECRHGLESDEERGEEYEWTDDGLEGRMRE